MKKYALLSLLCFNLEASIPIQKKLSVGLTDKLDSIIVQTSKQHYIEIKRIQDEQNRLTDDFTKTSRPCPPFCIQPTKVDKDIRNIAELEVLEFIAKKVPNQKGILIDARLKSFYELEAIPCSIDLPYETIEHGSKENIEKIFKILGMTINKNGKWNFKNVKELAIYDNGIWCKQATLLVQALLQNNYPKKKISYYRAGLQGWKLLGLTTIVHKEIIVKN